MMEKKTVFLDRDGTLIEEVNFLSRVEDLKLFPFTAEAVELLKSNGFMLIVITNQSGIDRGLYTEEAMHSIHREIQKQLNNAIDAFYFCPHLPDAGCDCRKPMLGMIKKARKDNKIDMASSWVIGDKVLDVELGFSAEIRTAMVKTGYGMKHLSKLTRKPSVIADNLLDAVKVIVSKSED